MFFQSRLKIIRKSWNFIASNKIALGNKKFKFGVLHILPLCVLPFYFIDIFLFLDGFYGRLIFATSVNRHIVLFLLLIITTTSTLALSTDFTLTRTIAENSKHLSRKLWLFSCFGFVLIYFRIFRICFFVFWNASQSILRENFECVFFFVENYVISV